MRFEDADEHLRHRGESEAKSKLRNVLPELIPARVSERLLTSLGIDGDTRMGHLPRETRRTLAHALTSWKLPVRDSRGFRFAEVTAGGVALTEINPATMESRKCPGLYLVGEILDVDGRIGGFNFQWAWSSGHVAGRSIANNCLSS
jgi:hypothetical protein